MSNQLTILLLLKLLFGLSSQTCTSTVAITSCPWDSFKLNKPLQIENYKQYLSISNGNLELIPSQSFKLVPQVTILEIRNNKLTKLEEDTFDGLSSLIDLNLYNNQIQLINKHTFNKLKKIEKLDLGMNKISEIHPQTFNNLSNLKYINLAFNSFKSIPSAINSLKNLQILNLGNNEIKTLKANIFNNLNKLEYLLLSDNKLNSIETGGFKGLTSLLNVDLSSNYLSNLDVDDLKTNARKVRSIKISINSFKCDVLNQIVTKLKSNNVEVSRGFSRNPNNIEGISCTK